MLPSNLEMMWDIKCNLYLNKQTLVWLHHAVFLPNDEPKERLCMRLALVCHFVNSRDKQKVKEAVGAIFFSQV